MNTKDIKEKLKSADDVLKGAIDVLNGDKNLPKEYNMPVFGAILLAGAGLGLVAGSYLFSPIGITKKLTDGNGNIGKYEAFSRVGKDYGFYDRGQEAGQPIPRDDLEESYYSRNPFERELVFNRAKYLPK
ncbi:MAG: hypothetical protein AABX03_03105 [Nanoarchaeota archaeon]